MTGATPASPKRSAWRLPRRRSGRPGLRPAQDSRRTKALSGPTQGSWLPLASPQAPRSALHPHLGRDRAGVAHVLVVVDLLAALETVEVAGQQGVAVEIEQATLLGQQESELLLRRDPGNLTW